VAEIIHKDESRRHEFVTLGILNQIPVKAVDIFKRDPFREVKLQFHCPVIPMTLSPWNSSCKVSAISRLQTSVEFVLYSMDGKANGKKKRSRSGQLPSNNLDVLFAF
jgi:hypothetical protein